jgi:cyclophilin family peptidyl-prolyl cis-trans isomerase
VAGPSALRDAYERGRNDTTYIARAAALAALARYGPAEALPYLRAALEDRDWPVRVRAAALLKELDPSIETVARIRPAPEAALPGVYDDPRIVAPPVSTQAFIDTPRGPIQLELAVLDAPITVENFTVLARKGFFDGLTVHRVVPGFVVQTGDPRGDGEGGPGYSIRDEINQQSYVRGAVGMALDWADTGGSQFFIATAPQPQLDGRYTVFGRVLEGMDVVDRLEQGDVIERVRIWNGLVQ